MNIALALIVIGIIVALLVNQPVGLVLILIGVVLLFVPLAR